MADLRHAVKLEPDHDKYLNAVAWLAATSPDEKLRDGKYAVACATKSVKAVKNIEGEFLIPLRDYTLITYLDILAAAHAEMGEFKEAVRAQNDALKIVSGFDRESLGIAAEVAGKKPADLKKEFGAMKERLALYRDMIPYRAK